LAVDASYLVVVAAQVRGVLPSLAFEGELSIWIYDFVSVIAYAIGFCV
jgi:hypothetical protein